MGTDADFNNRTELGGDKVFKPIGMAGVGGGVEGRPLNPDQVNTFFNALELVSSSSNQGASDLALLEEAERRLVACSLTTPALASSLGRLNSCAHG